MTLGSAVSNRAQRSIRLLAQLAAAERGGTHVVVDQHLQRGRGSGYDAPLRCPIIAMAAFCARLHGSFL